LIDALDEYKEKSNNLNRIRKLHFREIMQRDENRFDFRLDYDDITTQNLVDEGARRGGYDIQATFEMVDDVTFNTFPIWKKLGLKTGKWIPLVRRILGNDCRLIKGGCVISLPGTNMQYWHSDGIHIGSVSTFENPNQASNTHALCVFVPLIDLTEETGYTEFWAGSHKYDKLLSKKGEQSIPGGTKGKMKHGSCLLYDYRTIHRGTSNVSDRERPVCYFLYTKKGYEDVEDQNFVSSSVFGL
jgi:ectoine hydroxylase-related dioxygenase (phytanoyl-CoA dioxygenase family)